MDGHSSLNASSFNTLAFFALSALDKYPAFRTPGNACSCQDTN